MRYVVNQGKGLLVEIEHYAIGEVNHIDQGLINLFLPPAPQNLEEYKNNLRESLTSEGLHVVQVRDGARSDFPGRNMVVVTYQDTLPHAQAAVKAHRHLVADPASLKELGHRERVELGEKHWRQKDEEWDNAVCHAQPPRTSGKEQLKR